MSEKVPCAINYDEMCEKPYCVMVYYNKKAHEAYENWKKSLIEEAEAIK